MLLPGVALTGSNQQVFTGSAFYQGFTIGETSGTSTAQVILYDNTAASGTILDVINLQANESAREYYVPGRLMSKGVYASVVSGSVTGTVFVGN